MPSLRGSTQGPWRGLGQVLQVLGSGMPSGPKNLPNLPLRRRQARSGETAGSPCSARLRGSRHEPLSRRQSAGDGSEAAGEQEHRA
jgi:hypothetical protein